MTKKSFQKWPSLVYDCLEQPWKWLDIPLYPHRILWYSIISNISTSKIPWNPIKALWKSHEIPLKPNDIPMKIPSKIPMENVMKFPCKSSFSSSPPLHFIPFPPLRVHSSPASSPSQWPLPAWPKWHLELPPPITPPGWELLGGKTPQKNGRKNGGTMVRNGEEPEKFLNVWLKIDERFGENE